MLHNRFRALLRRTGLVLILGIGLLTLTPAPVRAGAPESPDTSLDHPAPIDELSEPPSEHAWLPYAALAMGIVNLMLVYLLYRAPSNALSDSSDAAEASRTHRRLDKRKREIDELRYKVDALTTQLKSSSVNQMTAVQVQELVRALVHDELARREMSPSAAEVRPPVPTA